MAIPAKFRSRLSEEERALGWMCLPWANGPTLRLYPAATFDRVVGDLGGALVQTEEEDLLEAELFASIEQLDMDQNHRVRLPIGHMDLVGLRADTPAVVIGAANRLEIYERDAWAARAQQRFAGLPGLVGKRGRAAPARTAPHAASAN